METTSEKARRRSVYLRNSDGRSLFLSAAEPQEAESPKPDSYDNLEEMETDEDRSCPGPPKSMTPKAGPATKGQAGDGPEPTELPQALGMERKAMELEKVRMEFELTRLKYLHEENERQRQHEAAMEQLQQQATPRPFSGGLQDLLLPQNQFAMFLYCFIFIHIIYVTKEMVFFLFSKHYLFCIAAILLCLIKTLWSYFQVPLLSPSLGTPCLSVIRSQVSSSSSYAVPVSIRTCP